MPTQKQVMGCALWPRPELRSPVTTFGVPSAIFHERRSGNASLRWPGTSPGSRKKVERLPLLLSCGSAGMAIYCLISITNSGARRNY
jgi:hypothetical protein